jgi:hypothetical protein
MPESLQCASCGAPISFLSGASVFAVCKYCSSTQIRTGSDLATLGLMGELKEDFSVLQLGTQGRAESLKFDVAGRIRLKWERGVWDEWYLVLENGKDAWLAEAQGFYYFSKAIPNEKIQLTFPLSIGQKVVFENVTFDVKDYKKATCVYSEGELPFSGSVGENYDSYDLFNNNGDFLSVSQVSGETLIYKGRVYSYQELSLYNLKMLDGWSPE